MAEKIEGEDVEYAVRLIKATYTVLRNASSLNRHYVPREFTKTVFEFFQTSSVPEFNATFLDEQRKLQVQADKDGVQPVWPSLTVVCRLATVTYRRLKANGVWDGIVDRKSNQAFVGTRPEKPPDGCFNCGGDHWLDKCPRPIDQLHCHHDVTELTTVSS